MKIKIGTRKSKLAIAQTKRVANAIKSRFPRVDIELVPISTRGDKILDKPLYKIGGKGIFVSDIEQAMIDGKIDIAVHSAKDLPVRLADGLEISAVLPRENYRDALVTMKEKSYGKYDAFTVGTGSLRRRLNIKKLYPNVKVKDIRGNVDTRLKKLSRGEFDGLVLAAAGLERLKISHYDYCIREFDYDEFLPAPCQGIIAAECRKNDFVSEILREVSDKNTYLCFETEREVLKIFDGDCTVPIGAYSEIRGDKIYLQISKNLDFMSSGTAEISQRFKLAEELISQL